MLSESKLIEAFTQVAVGFFHLLFNFVGPEQSGERNAERKMDLIGYSSVDVKSERPPQRKAAYKLPKKRKNKTK